MLKHVSSLFVLRISLHQPYRSPLRPFLHRRVKFGTRQLFLALAKIFDNVMSWPLRVLAGVPMWRMDSGDLGLRLWGEVMPIGLADSLEETLALAPELCIRKSRALGSEWIVKYRVRLQTSKWMHTTWVTLGTTRMRSKARYGLRPCSSLWADLLAPHRFQVAEHGFVPFPRRVIHPYCLLNDLDFIQQCCLL